MSISIKLLHGIEPLRYAGTDNVVYVVGTATHDGVKYNAVITISNDDEAPYDDIICPSVSIDMLPSEGEVLWLTDKISLELE